MNNREFNDFDPEKLEEEVLDASDDISSEEIPSREDLPEEMTIIGVRFREAGKIYYFDPEGVECSVGESVIVRTSRGSEIGHGVIPNKVV